jgi:hypothetical protein
LLITTLSEQKDLFVGNSGEQLAARVIKTSSIQTKRVTLALEVKIENDLYGVLEVKPNQKKECYS